MTLKIEDVDPVLLDGYVDDDTVKFRYDGEELSEYGDQIELISDSVRVIISVPSALEDPKVTHEGERDTVVWDSTSAGFEHHFRSAVTDPVEVETQSSNGHQGAVYVKVTPKGGLPDPTP